jgi:hypothetical protein
MGVSTSCTGLEACDGKQHLRPLFSESKRAHGELPVGAVFASSR